MQKKKVFIWETKVTGVCKYVSVDAAVWNNSCLNHRWLNNITVVDEVSGIRVQLEKIKTKERRNSRYQFWCIRVLTGVRLHNIFIAQWKPEEINFFLNCGKFVSFQDDWSIIIKPFPYLTCYYLHKIMELLASTQRKGRSPTSSS